MRRAAKVDDTQDAIVKALRATGASVLSLAAVGNGAPDLLVCVREGECEWLYTLECKTGKGKLRASQEKFAAEWRGTVHVVRTPDEALRVIGAIE